MTHISSQVVMHKVRLNFGMCIAILSPCKEDNTPSKGSSIKRENVLY